MNIMSILQQKQRELNLARGKALDYMLLTGKEARIMTETSQFADKVHDVTSNLREKYSECISDIFHYAQKGGVPDAEWNVAVTLFKKIGQEIDRIQAELLIEL